MHRQTLVVELSIPNTTNSGLEAPWNAFAAAEISAFTLLVVVEI